MCYPPVSNQATAQEENAPNPALDEKPTSTANRDASGSHSQAEMLQAIAPFKRSPTWLKDVRSLIETTLEQCPGDLCQRLKTPTGSYTDWGLERFLECFNDTRNTELTTKGKKIEEKPRKPALSRSRWQEKMYQRYGKLEEAQPKGFYAEDVKTLQRCSDQGIDLDTDQDSNVITLAEFVNDDAPNVAAEISEGTDIILSEGKSAIVTGHLTLDQILRQRGDALKEKVRQVTVTAIVQGEASGLADAAAMLAEQAPDAPVVPTVKKETRRKK